MYNEDYIKNGLEQLFKENKEEEEKEVKTSLTNYEPKNNKFN